MEYWDEEFGGMSAEGLIRKPNCDSPVWNYFGLVADENGLPIDKRNPICRTCWKVVRVTAGRTSNLYRHLKTYHPHIFVEVSQMKKT